MVKVMALTNQIRSCDPVEIFATVAKLKLTRGATIIKDTVTKAKEHYGIHY